MTNFLDSVDWPRLMTKLGWPNFRFHDLRGTAISQWIAAGIPLTTVLTQLVTATGQGIGNAQQLSSIALASGSKVLEGAYVAHGSAVRELQVFCDSVGLDWSFQDNQFMGAPIGKPYRADGPLLSPQTGLTYAMLDRRGNVEGKALLLPDLIPGVGFRTDSDSVTGDFIANQTTHEGDNYDEGRWHVVFHGIPLGATSDGLVQSPSISCEP